MVSISWMVFVARLGDVVLKLIRAKRTIERLDL